MPGIDTCQPEVEGALQKAGWHISSTQYYLRYELLGGHGVYLDLKATERLSNRAMYVEIKCFDPAADHDEFFRALGQYLTYRAVLSAERDPSPLYLTLPANTYKTFNNLTRQLLIDLGIKLIVIDLVEERIVQWIA